jgi:poly(3-hydroxybutyrate) depolymerase
MTVMGAGHYGIFSGRRWRTEVYPVVRDFIAVHAAVTVDSTATSLGAVA